MYLILLFFLLGYILGSLPVAYLVVRWKRGVDIREAGSGNVGAFNSLQVTRSKAIGAAVLLLDLAKGYLAGQLAGVLSGYNFVFVAAAGIGAIAGHNYPVWLGWRGGRGLATAAGVMFVVAPAAVAVWCLLWTLGYWIFREVNVGNAVACVATLLGVLGIPFDLLHRFLLLPGEPAQVKLFIVVLFVLLLSRLVDPVVQYVRERSAS